MKRQEQPQVPETSQYFSETKDQENWGKEEEEEEERSLLWFQDQKWDHWEVELEYVVEEERNLRE